MATTVTVQRDGIVNHSHLGKGGQRWHNPASKHADANLHAAEKADAPVNLKDLSAEHKAQYKQALAGKSFYGIYYAARDARRALHEVQGVVAAAESITAAKAAERDVAEFPLELR